MNAPVNTDDTRLYEEHRKVYPKAVKGTYRKLKWVIMSVLLAIYYITPWIRFDRGPNAPDQAILLDLGTRRFYFFFAEIWAQEVYYFAGAMVVAALGLFLVTSMVGRAWCGYACPQTVWTDLFVHVERWIEGDRSARIRLDKGGWSLDKLRKKIAKHGIWLLISVATGGAWIFTSPMRRRCWVSCCTGPPHSAPYSSSACSPGPRICSAGSRASKCASTCARGRVSRGAARQRVPAGLLQAGAGRAARPDPQACSAGRCTAGRLHRLQGLRPSLPNRHGYPRRAATLLHPVRVMHRRLRRDHG
nr:4Fe-4S binding protein [Hankyongella ginsenosidimutans]